METIDPNPMPEIKLFRLPEVLRKLGHFLFDQVAHDPQPYESNHYRAPEQLQFDEVAAPEADWHRKAGW